MFDLALFIKTIGYIGLFLVVFSESGLLIGVFLPGDSLVFTAGFVASQGYLHLTLTIIIIFIGALLGDNVGYWFGRRIGPKIFVKEDSVIFHRDNLERARIFYKAHGGKTILFARFLPIVRTFAPLLAGIGKMPYPTFIAFDLIGAILWGIGLPFLGYYLGRSIENIDQYLLPIIIVIIIISFLPTFIHVMKNKAHRQKITKFLKSRLTRV